MATHWRVETRFSEFQTTLKIRKLKARSEEGILKELASFIDTLRWLLWATASDPIPVVVVTPLRKGRHAPRVIKDLPDTYPKMRQPRAQLRKELENKRKMLK